ARRVARPLPDRRGLLAGAGLFPRQPPLLPDGPAAAHGARHTGHAGGRLSDQRGRLQSPDVLHGGRRAHRRGDLGDPGRRGAGARRGLRAGRQRLARGPARGAKRGEAPQEYAVLNVVAEAIPEWEALDTLACARLMTDLLSASTDSEMEWGAAFSRLAAESVDAAVDLFTLRPAAKVYTLPQGEGPAALRIARPEFDRASVAGLVERLARARPLLERALAERE